MRLLSDNVVGTLHTDGDNDLGGANWTDRVVGWVAEQIAADTGVDIDTVVRKQLPL